MTITLGGVTLPEDMYLDGPFKWSGVAGAVERSLGGNLIIWEAALLGGEPLDLIAEVDSGWIAYPVVAQLQSIANVVAAEYELNYRTHIYNVRFRHEEAPVLDVTPLITRIEFESDSYYYGKIKLMVVN